MKFKQFKEGIVFT